MKKYIEILEEIKAARDAIVDTAKTEKELDRIALKSAINSGDVNAIQTAREQYKQTEAKYIAEHEHNQRQKLIIEVLKDNAAQAFMSENIRAICEIWNKYAGKPHGEKTSKKIRDELREAVGCWVYIRNEWRDADIMCSFDYNSGAPFDRLQFKPRTEGSENAPALVENKVVPLDPDAMRVYCRGEYVKNPAAHVDEIMTAHKAAMEAEKALEAAISKYNGLLRGGMNHANKREGIKPYIM